MVSAIDRTIAPDAADVATKAAQETIGLSNPIAWSQIQDLLQAAGIPRRGMGRGKRPGMVGTAAFEDSGTAKKC
jgi:hypothetical protein